MVAEIECKIMNMSIAELMELASLNDITLTEYYRSYVTDEYWEAPNGKLIRFRCSSSELDGELHSVDLTIKGEEESDSRHVSERYESIIKLEKNNHETDVRLFFSHLNVKHKCEIKKERVLLHHEGNYSVLIQHDRVIYGSEVMEWVEVESANGHAKDVYDFLVNLGVPKERVSKESTLDILKIS